MITLTFPWLVGLVALVFVATLILVACYKSPMRKWLCFAISTITIAYLLYIMLWQQHESGQRLEWYLLGCVGIIGAIGNGLYGASKAALVGYVKSLALELAPRDIRVNTVNPGITETNIYNNSSITPEQLEQEKAHYPLKRFGKPEEIANAIVFLLSDASKWMTGSSLLIDGGCSLV